MSLQPKTILFKPEERNIFFHILTACNLSCRHCYINRGQHGAGTLDITTIERWLGLFRTPDPSASNVIFLGGEPTLHPDLPRAVRYAKELGFGSVTIDSNGYLHHDLLEKITPEEAVISFSLDGPDPTVNDRLRGKGVFTTCTANLQKAVDKGFDVSVIYTVNRENLQPLVRMPELLSSLGCKRFFIQVIGLRGSSAKAPPETLQPSIDEWLSVVVPTAQEAARLGIHVIYPKVFLKPNEPFQCAGRLANNFFLFPNGRVYLCPLCEDYPIHAYEIADNRLAMRPGLTERRFFDLDIPEGCVMHKLLQPDNIVYDPDGRPSHRISCCLLKQEICPATG